MSAIYGKQATEEPAQPAQPSSPPVPGAPATAALMSCPTACAYGGHASRRLSTNAAAARAATA